MLPSSEGVAPSQPDMDSPFGFRFFAGVLLLAVAVAFTWLTIDGLSARRRLRTELAEISHARYELLNADVWVKKMLPILDANIDKLDLKSANQASLRPTVENALYHLLDDVKQKMTAPKPQGNGAPAAGGFLAQGNALMVNLMVGSRRPRARICGRRAGGIRKAADSGGRQEIHQERTRQMAPKTPSAMSTCDGIPTF